MYLFKNERHKIIKTWLNIYVWSTRNQISSDRVVKARFFVTLCGLNIVNVLNNKMVKDI